MEKNGELGPIPEVSATTQFVSRSPAQKVDTGYAEVNGTQLYYEIAGSGDPIVLVHGNFGDRRYYDGQFEAFAKSYRVLRYDVRGYGKSMLPVTGIPYSDHEDLKALMEHLDIPRAHIAGSSMGSVIAVDFVLAYPEMCSSVIAIGPWVNGYSSPATQSFFQEIQTIRTAGQKGGPAAALEKLVQAQWWYPEKVPPLTMDSIKEICSDYSFWHFINSDPRQFVDPPAVQQLDRIRVPVLIITAQYDSEACREIADLMDADIPDSRKIDMDGATHMMQMEKPEEFNKAVLDFLSDIQE
jgi:pimeloyl-ACP methyl ester carboxylesterase